MNLKIRYWKEQQNMLLYYDLVADHAITNPIDTDIE